MKLALGNIGIGARSRTGGLSETPVRYWDEDDRRARYNAVSDALWIYQDREVEQNLRRFGWRQARQKGAGAWTAEPGVDKPRTRRAPPDAGRTPDALRERRSDHRLEGA